MDIFVPDGYLTLERALEHFGQLKHANEWEAEKALSKREFQQHLFAADLPAEVLTDDGIRHSLRSSIWGSVEAERIFETWRAGISVGNEYFPDTVHGPVIIEQSSIDALFDGDSYDPSQSPEAISDGALGSTAEASSAQEASMPRHQYRTHLLDILEKVWSDIDASDWEASPPKKASIETDLQNRFGLTQREAGIIATMFIPDNRRGKAKKG